MRHFEHGMNVGERQKTPSLTSRMRYSYKIFDPHTGSSATTSGLSRCVMGRESVCTATVQQRQQKGPILPTRPFQQFLELIDHVAGSEMRTRDRAEDVIVLLPQFACR